MLLTLSGAIRVVSVVSLISIDLSGAKNFWIDISGFDCSWGSSTPVLDTVGNLALSSASSVGFNFRLLRSMDGGAVIMVLAVGSALFEDCSQGV
jgi:hypothetical protein